MNETKVSVVICAFNAEQFIAECIESVINQEFNDFEIVIVDDCSTDSTSLIVQEYTGTGLVKLIRLEQNVGAASARNLAIAKTSSDLIAIIDADDTMYPNRLGLQYQFLQQNKDHVIVGGNASVVDLHGNYIFTTRKKRSNIEIQAILPNSPFIHPSVMFRKSAFKECGGYPSYMLRSQDTVLINRLLKIGKGHNLESALVRYRLTPGSNSLRRRSEKLRFQDIVQKAIETDAISPEDTTFIRSSINRNRSQDKMYNYYVLLTKKYLWNAGRKRMSRKNAIRSLRVKFTFEALLLLFISALPSIILMQLHSKFKGE